MSLGDSNCPEVFENICKLHEKWVRISRMLVQEGAEVRIWSKFYTIMVQSVIFHRGSGDRHNGVPRVSDWYTNKLGSNYRRWGYYLSTSKLTSGIIQLWNEYIVKIPNFDIDT